MLEDIAILTGGQVIAEELGDQARERQLERPRARQASRHRQGQHHDHRRRAATRTRSRGACEQIRAQIEKTTSDYDREKLQERLAKLSGGVAVIRVGAPSEAEMKSRKEALEDAISATKAAVAEGIVPGGGLALLRAIEAVEREEAQVRRRRAHRRCGSCGGRSKRPTRQIAENSAVDGGVVVEQMRDGTGQLSASTPPARQYVDLVEAGIIDPTKVVRVALENAVSVASVLLLTEATMTEIEEKKEGGGGGLRG